jgi:hypothetical protein
MDTAQTTEMTTPAMAPSEIEQRAAAATTHLQQQLMQLVERRDAAAWTVERLEAASAAARTQAKQIAQHLAKLPGQLDHARVWLIISAGTAGETAANERLASVEADEATTRETNEVATRRAHAPAEELHAARTTLAAADADLTANQSEMTRLWRALDEQARDAHRTAGRAEVARIEAEIAAGEERVRAAEAALAEARAAVEATRSGVAEQLRPYADIGGEWQHLRPRHTSLEVRALRAHVAYLETLKAVAEDGHSAVWQVRNQSVAGVMAMSDRLILDAVAQPQHFETQLLYSREMLLHAELEAQGK